MTNAIKVSNLSKVYCDFKAVDEISFEIPYGQITALLGANGAGKSTTLNMLAGIILPSSGSIEIQGQSFQKNYKDIKANMGYLTCDMALYDVFSVFETLNLLSELKQFDKRWARQRIDELISIFELEGFVHKLFKELSSGQKQRALIASAVLHDPKILIFDEVTASLDVVISKSIMDFLKNEKERGKAIIFSTHILSEVEYLSDRILVIDHGKILKETTYPSLIKETGANTLTDAFYHVFNEGKKAA